MASKEDPAYLPSVGRLLGFATAACRNLSNRRLKAHNLTISQWIPLTALWRDQPLSESRLAQYCRMTPSALNKLIDRMQEKSLVRRSVDVSDRRRVLVHLGAEGEKLSHLLTFYDGINEEILAGFDEDERRVFVDMLERVDANVKRALE